MIFLSSFFLFLNIRMEDIFRPFDLQLPQQSWVEREDRGTRFRIQSIRRQRRRHRNRRLGHAPAVQAKPRPPRPTRVQDWLDSEILAIRYVLRLENKYQLPPDPFDILKTPYWFPPFYFLSFFSVFPVFYEFGAAVPEQHSLCAWIRHIERVRQSHQHFHVIDERSSHQRYCISFGWWCILIGFLLVPTGFHRIFTGFFVLLEISQHSPSF